MLPSANITALSNSRTQKEYIDREAARRNLRNVTVITGDIVDYEFEPGAFDRVVSIEVYACSTFVTSASFACLFANTLS